MSVTVKFWTEQDLSAAQLMEKRYEYLKICYVQKVKFPEFQIKRLLSRFIGQHPSFADNKTYLESCSREITDFIEMGVTRINLRGKTKKEIMRTCVVNPTFVKPNNRWIIEENSTIFLAFDCDMAGYDGKENDIASLCFRQLAAWVTSYQHYVKRTCSPQYTLWFGDALHVVDRNLPDGMQFDFIDTSNLCDTTGLLNVIVHCQPRLKRDNGILTTEMFHFFVAYAKITEVFEKCIGCSPSLLPTIFGLHFAVDLDIGTEKLRLNGDFVGVNIVTFHWKVARDLSTLNIKDGKADVGIDAIRRVFTVTDKFPFDALADSWCSINKQNSVTRWKILTRLMSVCDEQSYSYLLDVIRQPDFAKMLDSDIEHHTKRTSERQQNQVVVTVVKEFKESYHVVFKLDSKLCFGEFSMDYTDASRKDGVCFTFSDASTTLKHKCQLSCPILLSSSKIKVSMKAGEVTCDLLKDLTLTSGELVLPLRPLFSDVTKVPNYEKSDENDRELYEIKIHRVYPRIHRSLHDIHKMSGWNILMELLFCTYVEFNSTPQIRTIQVTYGDCSKELKNFSMMFTVDSFKIVENLPTLVVRWVDFDEVRKNVQENKTTEADVMAAIEKSRDLPRVYNLGKLAKLHDGFVLLKKIIALNTRRSNQVETTEVALPWQNSFIRPRYPFMPFSYHLYFANMGELLNRDGSSQHVLDPTEFYLKSIEIIRPGLSRIDIVRQLHLTTMEKMDKVTPPMCQGNRLLFCDSCATANVSCKRCTKCYSVYYCSRECQKKDWREHKKVCKQRPSQ
ncbi:uncharacterized protein LOC121387056 [Gigantopelta aegis]|uniref:uncharacterized protein LOC121387056 n=1 Tax=Gigantopelta aegis TaxID=1735272 RepID=UPI001B889071|nr:uncharacterized protein LOC121387056 [Gigantopelta aegis]